MSDGTNARGSRIEEVLPLSPLQQGLLFHAGFDGTGDGTVDVYGAQLVIDLDGPLDADRLRNTATALAERHACLRTAFVRDVGRPLQVVLRTVEVPFTVADLTGADPDERERRRARLVARDRDTRFDLERPPLIRFLLIRLAEARHQLVVSNHHLVMDGWSTPVLLRDLFALYAAGADSPGLPPVRPYRDFLSWLAGRDDDAARAAWARALDGFEEPTPLVPGEAGPPTAFPRQVEYAIDAERTAALTALAGRIGVTPNTVVQAGWGVVLGRVTGREDVVFGATVSGRPADLSGVESTVGLFINTLPVRVELRPAETAAELLIRLQGEQADLLDAQHVGLGEIARQAGLGAAERGTGELFDTLLVFESFPFDSDAIDAAQRAAGLCVTGVDRPISTHYPLTLMVTPSGGRFEIVAKYRADLLAESGVRTLLERLDRVLHRLVTDPQVRVAELDALGDGEQAALLRQASADGPPPSGDTLADLLERGAALRP
ncbi:condensation domain-containing protein, partial [Actinoallomurus acaciae]